MTAPEKRWRVYVPQLSFTSHGSQEAAYKAARNWLGLGHHATIRHWEAGAWVLVEQLHPSAEPEDEGLFPAPPTTAQGGQHL